MSGKEDLIPGLTDQISEKPTCSLTQPHSLIDGYINEMKSAATNPGYVGAVSGAAAIAVAKSNNPISTLSNIAGAEGVIACSAGIINTAIKNCNETNPNKVNLPSI